MTHDTTRAALSARLTEWRAAGGGWREGPPDADGWYFVEEPGRVRPRLWSRVDPLGYEGETPVLYDGPCGDAEPWPEWSGRPARYQPLTLPAPPESEGR